MDPTTFNNGLTLSAIGLTLTFLTLGLMVLPIWLVNRYQEAHPPKEEAAPAAVEEEAVPCVDTGMSEAEVAAAVAVSILAARREMHGPAGLGAALESGPGRWWTPSNN